MLQRRWLTLVLGSWLSVSVPTLVLAQAQPPADAAKKQEEARERIQKLLDEQLVETKPFQQSLPLAKVLAILEKQLPKDKKLALRIDEEALGNQFADVAGTPIVLPALKKTSLRAVLETAVAKSKMKIDYRIGAMEVTITTPQQALYTVPYDIRELVDKPEVVKHLSSSGHTSGAEPGVGKARVQKAAWVIGAVERAVDGGKPRKADLDAIQVVNGTQLVIRTNAGRHAQIASMLNGLHGVADVAVIVKAHLYEIDEASYNKLKNAKSIPSEEAERLFLEGKLPRNALFDRLGKQKHVVAGEEFKVDSGRAATLLSWHKAVFCLPSPDQLRRGDKSRQLVMEGVSFDGVIHVSPDRRYVRMDLTERYIQLREIQKVRAWWWPPAADERAGVAEQQMDAEIPLVNKVAHTRRIEIPDGGSILVPVRFRPASAQAAKQWWVLMITPHIYIEAEERAIRLGNMPPIPK